MGIPLSRIDIGSAAKILALSEECTGLARSRLLDLGMTPGAHILAERANTGGSAIAYRIRKTLIALRLEQAEQVLVQPVPVQSRD